VKRDRTGARYVYRPVGWDVWYPIEPRPVVGSVVTVVRLPGAPPPNAMGHCYVDDKDGHFAGLVSVASLQPRGTA